MEIKCQLDRPLSFNFAPQISMARYESATDPLTFDCNFAPPGKPIRGRNTTTFWTIFQEFLRYRALFSIHNESWFEIQKFPTQSFRIAIKSTLLTFSGSAWYEKYPQCNICLVMAFLTRFHVGSHKITKANSCIPRETSKNLKNKATRLRRSDWRSENRCQTLESLCM